MPSGHVPQFPDFTVPVIVIQLELENLRHSSAACLGPQHSNCESDSRLQFTTSYNCGDLGREPGNVASQRDFEEKISPLYIKKHKTRIPDIIPSLGSHVAREVDRLSPPGSTQDGSPDSEIRLEEPQSQRSNASTQPTYFLNRKLNSSVGPARTSTSAHKSTIRDPLHQYHTELDIRQLSLRNTGEP